MAEEQFKFTFVGDLSQLNNSMEDAATASKRLEKAMKEAEQESVRLTVKSLRLEKALKKLNQEFKAGRIDANRYAQSQRLLETSLERTNKQTRTAQGNFNRYRTALGRLGSGFQNQASSAQKALPVLQEFSRIISDAPFGIIGVGNNISELGNAFTRLSARAGGARAALTLFGRLLLSPVGLLVALNAVVTILTVWGDDLLDLIGKNDRFAKSFKDAVNSISDDSIKLQALGEIVKDFNGSTDDRLTALKELQKLYPEYLGRLDTEASSLREIEGALNAVNLALAKRAQVEGFSGALKSINEDASENLADLQSTLIDARKSLEFELAKLLNSSAEFDRFSFDTIPLERRFAAIERIAKKVGINSGLLAAAAQASNTYSDALQGVKDAEEELSNIQAPYLELLAKSYEELFEAQRQAQAAGGFDGEEFVGTPDKKKLDKLQDARDALAAFANDLAALFLPGGSVSQGLDEVFGKFELFTELLGEQGKKAAGEIRTSFEEIPKAAAKGMREGLEVLRKTLEGITEIGILLENARVNIENIFINGIEPSLSSIGETIGRELQRGASFAEAAGAGFVGALSGLISKVADELIKLGVAALAIGQVQAVLEKMTSGASKIAVALGAIATGVALKGLASAAAGFAGGTTSGGLSGSSGFTPNQSFSGSISGGSSGSFGGGGEVVFRISGTSLIGVIDRTLKGKNKTTSDIIG